VVERHEHSLSRIHLYPPEGGLTVILTSSPFASVSTFDEDKDEHGVTSDALARIAIGAALVMARHPWLTGRFIAEYKVY
jgi:hypothetical protein